MCEYCIVPEGPRTPEQIAAREAVRARLRESIDADLERKGVTAEEIFTSSNLAETFRIGRQRMRAARHHEFFSKMFAWAS